MWQKLDKWHFAILFGAPMLTAFLDYEVNSAAPFSKVTLEHALLSTLLVGVALVKQWAPPVPPPPAL